MKIAVIYASKTGFAKKYAEWIAEELRSGSDGAKTSGTGFSGPGSVVDLMEAKSVRPEMLEAYDTIVFGGGLYAVGINGIKLVKDNFKRLSGKKLAVFATGASPKRPETTDFVRDSNFTVEEQERIRFFYLRGGFDYAKLKPVDKILMTLLKLKIKMKKERERIGDERGMLAA